MCGILGFVTDKPSVDNAKFFRRLLLLSESRGAEATGIAYAKNEKLIVDKAPVAAQKFLTDTMPKHTPHLEKTNIAIGHTRYPTIGTPKDNNNNHPIETPNWVMVHNGSVMQMPRLKEYNYKGTVDSEILASYIETYGLEKGLPYVEKGTAAVAVINKQDLTSLYLWREVSPIILAYNDETKTLFFASQREFLERSLINLIGFFSTFVIREVPTNTLYHITTNPVTVKYMGLIEVMKWNSDAHKPTYKVPESTKDNYTKASSIRDLKWNDKTCRWELPEFTTDTKPTVAQASATASTTDLVVIPGGVKNDKIPQDEKEADKFLMQSGFTPIEVGRMTRATKITIMYNEYNPADIWIDSDGKIHKYVNSEPIQRTTEEKKDTSPNRYYIGGMSHDFRSWIKLDHPHKGHISVDGLLIKKWDAQKGSHFIMTLEDAVDEGVVPKEAVFEQESIKSLEDVMNDKINMEHT